MSITLINNQIAGISSPPKLPDPELLTGGLPQLNLVLQRPHEGARRPRPAVLQVEPALALDLRGDGRVDDGVAALRGGLHHHVADDLVQDLGGENEKMPFFRQICVTADESRNGCDVACSFIQKL